jgi:Choline/Carnitine o-acyltransferase
MKAHKVSPDAWAQLIQQLAFFKMHGRLAATYENAQTRRFRGGRTEVVRSLSSEAAEWVRAMIDLSIPKVRLESVLAGAYTLPLTPHRTQPNYARSSLRPSSAT